MEKKEYFIVDSEGDVKLDFEVTEGILEIIKDLIEQTLDNL